MPSVITKKWGDGQELSSTSQLRSYVESLDLVSNDSTLIIKVVGSVQWPTYLGLVSSDDTHRVKFIADDGQGPNDLNRSILNYPASGSEIVFSRFGESYGTFVGPGVDWENLRIRITGADSHPQFISFQHHANSIIDNKFRFCRLRDESVHPGPSFSFGVDGNISQISDCYVEIAGVANKTFAQNTHNKPCARNTFVGVGAAQGTAQMYGFGFNTILDTVAIGICRVAQLNNTITNCFANTPQVADSQLTGLTINATVGALVINETTDLRPSAGSPLINGGSELSQSKNDILGNNRGPTPDVGAWETSPFAPSPIGVLTTITVAGTTVTVSGNTQNTPTEGTVTLLPVNIPYNGAVTQGPASITLTTNGFNKQFTDVKVGVYTVKTILSSIAGSNEVENNQNNVIITGANGSVTTYVLDGDKLTISGTTTGNPTSVSIIVPPALTDSQGASAVASEAVLGSGTFTKQVTLGPGRFGPAIVRAGSAIGTSFPFTNENMFEILIEDISGSPEAPPVDASTPVVEFFGPLLRNLLQTTSAGYGICGTYLVGTPAADIPTGFAFPGLLENDILPSDPAGTLYREEIANWPSAVDLQIAEDGTFALSGPDGTYTGSTLVYKNGVSTPGTYNFQIGAAPVNATATGSISSITISAFSAIASASATAIGALSPISLQAPLAIASNGAGALAMGNLSPVNMTAPGASATGSATAVTSISAVNLSSAHSTASGAAFASANCSSITLSSFTATAVGTNFSDPPSSGPIDVDAIATACAAKVWSDPFVAKILTIEAFLGLR